MNEEISWVQELISSKQFISTSLAASGLVLTVGALTVLSKNFHLVKENKEIKAYDIILPTKEQKKITINPEIIEFHTKNGELYTNFSKVLK